MITSRTRLCGLIGDPVEHSLSPAMHNAAISHLGLDYVYLAFRVAREELGSAVQGMRGLNIRGMNVTIPHKVSVIPWLDELDELARDIGAVNTIVNESGRLKGYNTDARGFMQALSEGGIGPQGKNIALLGAGGAARAIGLAVTQKGAGLTILNRKAEFDWALTLAKSLNQLPGVEVQALELNAANLKAALLSADLLVNATSVGMSPNTDETPVPAELLRPEQTVFDIIYNPQQTRLLREAEARGCHTIGGLEMLIWQGALAFELWTGVKAPLGIMREAALRAMSGVTARAGKPDSKTASHNKTSIALIGFMGAGKSAVSKALARRLHKRLVEMDSLIEKQAGKSIPRIFKEDGEIAFRELEIAVTREVAPRPNQVIACGGGVVLNKINIDRLKKQAVVVYLKASAEVIHKRVAQDKLNRPLLNNTGKSQAVAELLAWREPFYERAADITLDTAKLGIKAISDKIITQLEDYEGFSF